MLYDEVGLQVAQHAGQTLLQAFKDRLPSSHIVPALVEAGQTGKANGLGFYNWRTRKPNPEVYRLLGEPGRRLFGQRAIQDRVRSTTQWCRPRRSLLSIPRLAIRGTMPRLRQARRQRG